MQRKAACLLWIAFLASPFFDSLMGCRRQAASNGLVPVRLQADWYPQPEQGGFYQALVKGYYRQEGLDVTIQPGGPYVNVDQQISVGAAEFGMGSSDRILEGNAQGEPLVAVGATMQRDPQGVMVHAASPVHSFADLEGQTVALKPGSTWFEYLVHRYNLKNIHEIPATYSIANFLQDQNYIQQVFVTSEPFFAQKAGVQVRTLLISDGGYSPYRVFFTSRDLMRQHPDVVARFVRASIRGWRDYMNDPSQVNAELLKLNPALEPEQMQFTWKALKDNHFIDGGTPDKTGQFDPARWTALYDQLTALKIIQQPLDPATVYTTQFTSNGK